MTTCTQCHSGAQQISADKCISCHAELKPQLSKGSGFHGRIPETDRSCQSCHHEHQGRDFHLIEWVPSKKGFPHQKVGFPLLGKHAQVDCQQCHTAPRTFLGLSTRCNACHFDEHRGQLGDQCQTCHREQAWKPAPGFDHRDTDFVLTGRHTRVACKACHPSQEDRASSAKSFLSFEKLPHQSCQDCHRDPHEGKFGAACTSCHSTAGWKNVKNAAVQKTNFHDQTRFPLEGLHRSVPCVSCHGPFPAQPAKFKGLKFQSCPHCHADPHLGQLAKTNRRASPACESCHTTDGFLPARFELSDHQKTTYPLEGAHQSVACVACHPAEPSLASRIPKSVRVDLKRKKRRELFSFALFNASANTSRCQSCHRDPHGEQFATKVASQGCTGCHRLTSFADLNFDHRRDSRFPLTGKHASATCGECHFASGAKQIVKYRPLDTSCQSCHADVHAKQFARSKGDTDCAACHQTEGFTRTLFLHGPPFTSFVLDGKHATVQCVACHPDVRVAEGVTVRRYRPVPKTCQGCHADFHHGAFRGFVPASVR